MTYEDFGWISIAGFVLVILWMALYQSFNQEDFMALADDLKAIKAQLDKARAEIVSKVNDLEIAVANAGTPTQEVTDAVADLKAAAQSLDDVVPDQDAVIVDFPEQPGDPVE